MAKKTDNALMFTGFSQAFGVALYIATIGFLFANAKYVFGNVPNAFMPVAFLLLFSFSALICGLLVFYKPYTMFFGGKKREAADLVVFTTAWLFAFFIAAFLLAAFM